MQAIIYSMIPVGLLTGVYLFLMIRRTLIAFGVDIKKKPVLAAALLVSLIAGVAACFFRKLWALILYYIVILDLLLRLCDLLIRKILKKKDEKAEKTYENSTLRKWLYSSGLVPVLVTAVIMICGVITMNNVIATTYEVQTEKALRPEGYRVVMIADSHYGVAGSYEDLVIKADEISSLSPDAVILCGDIVDETTEPAQVDEIFDAFGGIRTAYGVYFVWGNHDRSSAALHTQFSEEYLRNVIAENGITILEDEVLNINDDLVIVGREDKYEAKKGKDRKPMEVLMQDVDKSRFVICADHQPSSFEEESRCGVDLILSGHTHGGQIWPARQVEEILALDDGIYGRYEIGNTTAIVTSGFYGWSWPVKSGVPSEYVVVNIRKK
ncbi:MAG: metallophosphoesterase [Eubacteriales bacterium]|nr:metallophosphoesterase [Eubacteriales bacterium]